MGVPLRYTLEWQDDKNTAFNTAFSPDGTFDQLIIVVDVNTGEIISKEVMTAIHLDVPISTTVKYRRVIASLFQ